MEIEEDDEVKEEDDEIKEKEQQMEKEKDGLKNEINVEEVGCGLQDSPGVGNLLFSVFPFHLTELEFQSAGSNPVSHDSSSIAESHNPHKDSSSSNRSYDYSSAAADVPRGTTTFLGDVRNNSVPVEAAVIKNFKEDTISEFLSRILKLLFKTYRLPHRCEHQMKLEPKNPNSQVPDMIIFNNEEIVLVVEMKKQLKVAKTDGENQVISYSRKVLDMDKKRFMVLSMVCTANEFALFCMFRFKEDVAFVRLSDYDSFSFGSNGLGLIKLLYILQLPWPLYGFMPVIKEAGDLSILKPVRFLGSGSSAVVHEYTDNTFSFVFKFFRSIYQEQFQKEVEIYRALMNEGISKEMLWFNQNRCLICLRSVRNVVHLGNITQTGITDAYQFLRDFHRVTGNVHRDIYFRNLLISSEGKIYLNDFGLSVLENENSFIKGNVYFASDAVLLSEDDYHVYRISDDIYSLTFTFIYLIYENDFSPLFEVRNTRKDIYIKRKSLLQSIKVRDRDLISSTLKYASDSKYFEAEKGVIKILTNFFLSKFILNDTDLDAIQHMFEKIHL
jgi:hypothetical protein